MATDNDNYTDLDEVDESLDRGDEIEQDEDDTTEEETEDDSTESTSDENEESNDSEVDEDDDDEDIRIPKYRLDEIIAQREEDRKRAKWLEDQLEKLIGNKQDLKNQPEEIKFDFEAAEEKYASLILEGEASQAARLRAQIEAARRNEYMSLIKQVREEASKDSEDRTSKAIAERDFKSTISRIENQYPFLNADSKKYNEEAVDTVNTLMKGFVASGLPKAEALEKAVKKVLPFYKDEVKEVSKKPSLGETRKVEATKKAAKASNSQPQKAPTKTVEKVDLKAVDVTKLSEKAFKNLTPEEKRFLRGD